MRISKLACLLAVGLSAMTANIANAEYIKAVTYFGDAWPINYWNSDVSRAAGDFRQLHDEGFNAVILVVPWGEFQPGVAPIRYNEQAFDRLKQVCQTAKANNLQVFMRVSYLWDMYPGEQMPAIERANSLLSNDTLMPAWSKYLGRINGATKGCASGSFISWEDYWHMIPRATAAKPGQDAAHLAQEIGFDAWARKNAPAEFLKKYVADAQKFGAYPVPSRKSPDFQVVFKWLDDQLMKRLMPELAKQLPNASIESRVDDDPIYDGDKLIKWYSHEQTYKVPSSEFVMTYWAPAMGAKNESDVEPADKVLKRFSYMQQKILSSTKNKIFIEQLLFTDNTPSAAKNTAIEPGQIDDFIKALAGPLVSQTSGYALWGGQDYDASTIYNGFFSLGASGWTLSGGASVEHSKQAYAARLPVGASIAQPIPFERNHFRSFAKSTTLRFVAKGPAQLEASYAGTTRKVSVGAGEQLVKLDFPVATGDDKLTITGRSGTAKVTNIYLFTFTQLSGVRDSLGNPGPRLADIVAMNHAIDIGGGMPSRLSANDKTLGSATGVSYPEQSGSDWYAWASPDVQVRILPRSSTISVRGYMKPSMFRQHSCTVQAFVDATPATSKVFANDGAFDIDVPVVAKHIGEPVDLRLTSTCSINPKKDGTGQDDRTLSYILKEIDAGAH